MEIEEQNGKNSKSTTESCERSLQFQRIHLVVRLSADGRCNDTRCVVHPSSLPSVFVRKATPWKALPPSTIPALDTTTDYLAVSRSSTATGRRPYLRGTSTQPAAGHEDISSGCLPLILLDSLDRRRSLRVPRRHEACNDRGQRSSTNPNPDSGDGKLFRLKLRLFAEREVATTFQDSFVANAG